jgi:hypothetical protein
MPFSSSSSFLSVFFLCLGFSGILLALAIGVGLRGRLCLGAVLVVGLSVVFSVLELLISQFGR